MPACVLLGLIDGRWRAAGVLKVWCDERDAGPSSCCADEMEPMGGMDDIPSICIAPPFQEDFTLRSPSIGVMRGNVKATGRCGVTK